MNLEMSKIHKTPEEKIDNSNTSYINKRISNWLQILSRVYTHLYING